MLFENIVIGADVELDIFLDGYVFYLLPTEKAEAVTPVIAEGTDGAVGQRGLTELVLFVVCEHEESHRAGPILIGPEAIDDIKRHVGRLETRESL